LNIARHPEKSAAHHFQLNAGKFKPIVVVELTGHFNKGL